MRWFKTENADGSTPPVALVKAFAFQNTSGPLTEPCGWPPKYVTPPVVWDFITCWTRHTWRLNLNVFLYNGRVPLRKPGGAHAFQNNFTSAFIQTREESVRSFCQLDFGRQIRRSKEACAVVWWCRKMILLRYVHYLFFCVEFWCELSTTSLSVLNGLYEAPPFTEKKF